MTKKTGDRVALVGLAVIVAAGLIVRWCHG